MKEGKKVLYLDENGDEIKKEKIIKPARKIDEYFWEIRFELNKIRENADELFCNSELFREMYDEIENLKNDNNYYRRLLLKKNDYTIDNLTIKLLKKELEVLERENEQIRIEIKKYAQKNTTLRKKLREERSKRKLGNGELPEIGRKPKLSEHDKMIVRFMRQNGSSIRIIAKHFNCSVGLIHKIIHEDQNKPKKNKGIKTFGYVLNGG